MNICEADRSKPYSMGEYNKFDDKEQWIRLSEGCPNKCPFCRESFEIKEMKTFDIPEIVRNEVRIMDMNLLSKPEALSIIKELGRRRVNGKVVHYQLVCGLDYRFLTQEIATTLKQSRFSHLRVAWDFSFALQKTIKSKTQLLLNAGYDPKDIMVFMICNWKIPFVENMRKLELCKVWNFLAADCYFDNQISPNIKPIHWTSTDIKQFRAAVRKHNQLVNFGIDPEEREARGQVRTQP